MRCLTLADAITTNGGQCTFLCREHAGNLIEPIQSRGYNVCVLPMGENLDIDLAYSAWLGASQIEDIQVSAPLLTKLQPDWLVVDHYGLDSRWESAMTQYCGEVMVIDDLADRYHHCDILLDQTLGRNLDKYCGLVPKDCTLLCGSDFVLLRPEFSALRPYSLQRRMHPKLKRLLVTMGGVDKDNVTTEVLRALQSSHLPSGCEITVIVGATAPWQREVQQKAQDMPWNTVVLSGIKNMAEVMAESDLAISAAGSTSWELCCLGLPSIMIVLAENQHAVGACLERAGVARIIQSKNSVKEQLPIAIDEICNSLDKLTLISQVASAMVNGQGLYRVMYTLGV